MPVVAIFAPLVTVMPGARPTVTRPVTTAEPVVKFPPVKVGTPEAAW